MRVADGMLKDAHVWYSCSSYTAVGPLVRSGTLGMDDERHVGWGRCVFFFKYQNGGKFFYCCCLETEPAS